MELYELCRHLPGVKVRVWIRPGLRRGPGSVSPCYELIVSIIAHFSVSVRLTASKQAGQPIKSIIPRCENAVTFVRVTCVPLSCPTYWPTLVEKVKYVAAPGVPWPARPQGLMGHVLGEGDRS